MVMYQNAVIRHALQSILRKRITLLHFPRLRDRALHHLLGNTRRSVLNQSTVLVPIGISCTMHICSSLAEAKIPPVTPDPEPEPKRDPEREPGSDPDLIPAIDPEPEPLPA